MKYKANTLSDAVGFCEQLADDCIPFRYYPIELEIEIFCSESEIDPNLLKLLQDGTPKEKLIPFDGFFHFPVDPNDLEDKQ